MSILVIGAGFAGLSTAYHLARAGARGVVVIEQEKKLGGHASGNNAGMIRQAVTDPLLVRLACEGLRALREASKRRPGIRFKPRGSLLLAAGRDVEELRATRRALKENGVASRLLSRQQAGAKVSLLKEGDFESALLCPSDATVEIGGLLSAFLEELKALKVPVLCGHAVQAPDQAARFDVVVNAAGAWAGPMAKMAGAAQLPLKAYRRHLFVSKSFRAEPSWPFVWDLSHNFYFRVEGASLLFSPCDRTPVDTSEKESRREKVDARMKEELMAKLKAFGPRFRPVRLGEGRSGLRTIAQDGRFVIGEDPKFKRFYWVAGLGGHGVTTSFSVGRLAADLILNKKVDEDLKKAFSPKRFYAP